MTLGALKFPNTPANSGGQGRLAMVEWAVIAKLELPGLDPGWLSPARLATANVRQLP
jgi:hypothetical protein